MSAEDENTHAQKYPSNSGFFSTFSDVNMINGHRNKKSDSDLDSSFSEIP